MGQVRVRGQGEMVGGKIVRVKRTGFRYFTFMRRLHENKTVFHCPSPVLCEPLVWVPAACIPTVCFLLLIITANGVDS